MAENEYLDVLIISKLDSELSKRELHSVFNIYNYCFSEPMISGTKKTLLAKKLLGKSKVFEWYLAKVRGQIVGMASYVRDMEKVKTTKQFDLRPEKGENVCSVGVLEKYRRLGIGRLLMNQIIKDHGPEIDLVVEIKRNNPIYGLLVEFYLSLGFVEEDQDNQEEAHLYLRRKKGEIKS